MDSGSFFGSAFSTFDAYTYLMMLLIGIGAAFTMRGIGSLITATLAALVVLATAVFLRGVISIGFSSGDAVLLVNDEWTGLLKLQFGTLSVYALVVGTIVAASYGVLSALRD